MTGRWRCETCKGVGTYFPAGSSNPRSPLFTAVALPCPCCQANGHERPNAEQIETALDVLLWLHEHTEDGSERDEISYVRYYLNRLQDDT